MTIKKTLGYQTADGLIWATLNDAARHTYGKRLKAILKPNGTGGVFGVGAIIDNSRAIEVLLADYNDELDRINMET